MILIDNYDSFTYNVVEYLKELGFEPKVFKNNEITVEELKELNFEHLIISPGPGNPQNSSCGICEEVIKTFYKNKKILGICLGHQLIARIFGAIIIKDENPFHGKVSKIFHNNNSELFKNIPSGFEAARYHSLKINPASFKENILPLAQTSDQINMALKIKDYDVYGVQFHPEAILTQYGHNLLENFLKL